MSARRFALIGVVGVILLGCGTALPEPTTSVVVTASPTPSVAPSPSPEPPTQEPIPTGAATGWWGEDGRSYCGIPAYYRFGGKNGAIGPCLGVLGDPPSHVLTLAVGQDLDIHMSVVGQPYTLPTSSDPLVVRPWLITDASTMTYRALSAGTALLMTTGNCLIKDTTPTGLHEVNGPCPVVAIKVGQIPTDCTTLADDLCREAAAEAVLHGFFPESFRQVVVTWKAIPGSGRDWPGCGKAIVEVALTIRNPDWVSTVSVGQVNPDDPGPRKLAVCTY